LKLINEVPENLPPLRCDRHLMTRVLTNLYSNAIKYTDKGNVTIGAAVEPDRRGITMAMRDTGSGIERGRQERLFELFQGDPNRYDSNGVGLVFVNRAVSMHGGRVWLESEQGKGTTMYLRLPLGR